MAADLQDGGRLFGLSRQRKIEVEGVSVAAGKSPRFQKVVFKGGGFSSVFQWSHSMMRTPLPIFRITASLTSLR